MTMRGSTADERRAEQLQALTFLGLLADDVGLATLHYPELKESEERALAQLVQWIEPAAKVDRRQTSIRRPSYLSDPTELLHQTALIAQQSGGSPASSASLESLAGHVRNLLARKALTPEVAAVRSFADLISRVTLVLSEQLANEKGSRDWTPTASSSLIA
jgi:hypothetical protein